MWCSFKNMATDRERSYGDAPRMARQPIFLCLAALAGLSGLAAPATASWNRFELAPPVSSSISGQIASVSRIPNSMEIWWIALDGSVQGAYYYDGGQWTRYTLAPAGSARATFGFTGGITAVSRMSSHMEVWWVGADGSVQGANYYDGGQWTRYTLSPAGTAGGLGNGIKALSRLPNTMEVWWIGPDGSVNDAYYYDGAGWRGFQLAPAGSAAGLAGEELGSGGITAVSRIPGSMEVWWIAPDGSVQDAYWYDGNPWKQFQLAPAGSASRRGGITSVSRYPGSMEVWWIGPDGSVQDAYWYDGKPWTQFALAPAGSASPYGKIASVSRVSSSMEVWWTGPQGSIEDAYWYDGNPWQRFQLAPPGSAATSGGIAAVSRHPSALEIWWMGPDGSIQDAYWNDDQFVPQTLTFYSNWITTDQPLGGWANLVVSADGYFTFSGHMHDSGFDNIDYDAIGVLVLPSGLAFALHHHGHCDGTQTLIGRQRDDDWTDSATFNDFIRSHWAEMGQATWVPKVQATDDLIGGIEDWFNKVAQEVLDNLGEEAAAAVVVLLL